MQTPCPLVVLRVLALRSPYHSHFTEENLLPLLQFPQPTRGRCSIRTPVSAPRAEELDVLHPQYQSATLLKFVSLFIHLFNGGESLIYRSMMCHFSSTIDGLVNWLKNEPFEAFQLKEHF